MMKCNNCGAEHHQPGVDFCATVPTKILEERGEVDVDKCRVCGSTDLEEKGSIMADGGRHRL